MEIIPAIDIKNGKCVRLTQGDFAKENLYSNDPVKIAQRWKAEGATRLHIVDLDGARIGMPQNMTIIRDIIRRVGLPIQLGGGIRTAEVADRMLGIGIDRIIFGTAAIANPNIGETFQRLGEKAILGLDSIGGMVAVEGWQQATQITATQLAIEMALYGARRIIFTDIARDGMMQGPNLSATEMLMKVIKIPVIASGGVSKMEDISALKRIGVEGVIIGKSLYENTVRLPEAIALAH
jgi:phosphoribosylformimino-5-aminoimidazole carboxamide ribotide isomerase